MGAPREVARAAIPTPFGEFSARAFECTSGLVYVALVRGDLGTGRSVLVRLHSECLTGDVFGSLRCDCGVQLRVALRAVAAEGRGVIVYATGQEGRGIGLVNKLRAYTEQDDGADTLDANVRLGLPVDARDYHDAARVLEALGVRSVRLLTNNPEKLLGLQAGGVEVERAEPIAIAPHGRNVGYLRTKARRLGHAQPGGEELTEAPLPAANATRLLGAVEAPSWRPFVVVKYAQTFDGRIATATGDSKWISGEAERRISHALRAACDAVLVGVGTVIRDDPRLTVRMVPGSSPMRVVVDSSLRVPLTAKVFDGEAMSVVLTTSRSSPARRAALEGRHVGVRVVDPGPGGLDLVAGLRELQAMGVGSVLVEGGAGIITSMLAARVVDRLVVGVAPTIIGTGTEGVGDLGIVRVSDGVRLVNRVAHQAGDDLMLAWDVEAG